MLRHDAPLKSLLNIIPALRIFFFFFTGRLHRIDTILEKKIELAFLLLFIIKKEEERSERIHGRSIDDFS